MEKFLVLFTMVVEKVERNYYEIACGKLSFLSCVEREYGEKNTSHFGAFSGWEEGIFEHLV